MPSFIIFSDIEKDLASVTMKDLIYIIIQYTNRIYMNVKYIYRTRNYPYKWTQYFPNIRFTYTVLISFIPTAYTMRLSILSDSYIKWYLIFYVMSSCIYSFLFAWKFQKLIPPSAYAVELITPALEFKISSQYFYSHLFAQIPISII